MKICLYNLEQTGVIILDKVGLPYFNQSGGIHCQQAMETGYFVPISNDPPSDQPELALAGRLSNITKNRIGLNERSAGEINQLLKEISSSDHFEVDTEKLQQSAEAWIYLRIYPAGEFSTFGGADPFKAVLTWPNTDSTQ